MLVRLELLGWKTKLGNGVFRSDLVDCFPSILFELMLSLFVLFVLRKPISVWHRQCMWGFGKTAVASVDDLFSISVLSEFHFCLNVHQQISFVPSLTGIRRVSVVVTLQFRFLTLNVIAWLSCLTARQQNLSHSPLPANINFSATICPLLYPRPRLNHIDEFFSALSTVPIRSYWQAQGNQRSAVSTSA